MQEEFNILNINNRKVISWKEDAIIKRWYKIKNYMRKNGIKLVEEVTIEDKGKILRRYENKNNISFVTTNLIIENRNDIDLTLMYFLKTLTMEDNYYVKN